MSKINVNTWEPESGTAATLMASGDTVTLPDGAILAVASGGDINVASGGEIDIASGATLDVNGTIDLTGATKTGFPGGLDNASQWRLTADFTGDATPIGDSVGTVALVNTDGYASLGSDMTESSGVFAFPSTGYWLVIANFYFTTTTLTQVNGYIDYTANNGGAWSSAAWSGTSNYYGLMSSISINHIMDITDIANQKINFSVDANPSTGTGVVTTQGNATITETGFTFIKLADT